MDQKPKCTTTKCDSFESNSCWYVAQLIVHSTRSLQNYATVPITLSCQNLFCSTTDGQLPKFDLDWYQLRDCYLSQFLFVSENSLKKWFLSTNLFGKICLLFLKQVEEIYFACACKVWSWKNNFFISKMKQIKYK